MLFVLSLPPLEVCSQRLDWLPSAISQQYVSEKSHTNIPSQVITRLWAPYQPRGTCPMPVGADAVLALRCRKHTSATMLMPWKGTAVGRKTNAVLHS